MPTCNPEICPHVKGHGHPWNFIYKCLSFGPGPAFSVKNVDGKDYSLTVGRKWVATQAVVPKLTFLFFEEHPGNETAGEAGVVPVFTHPIEVGPLCQTARELTGLNTGLPSLQGLPQKSLWHDL